MRTMYSAPLEYENVRDLLKCVGVMILVTQPVDEFDESGLSDTIVLGAVHCMSRDSAERMLLEMVDDHLGDHGPLPEGQEIQLSFTTNIRYH